MSILPGVIDSIVGTIQELVIDEVTIDNILTMLHNAQSEMPTQTWGEVGKGDFGTLPASKEMSVHTMGAHEFVLASLFEMVQTLGVYSEGVKYFREGTNRADEFSATQLRHINEAIHHGSATNRRQGENGGDR